MHKILAAVALLATSGCVGVVPRAEAPQISVPQAQINSFVEVVNRVEPVATAYCRQLRVANRCNFAIGIDDRPDQQPNAFQTTDEAGRPLIGFTSTLLQQLRSADELAFILGHEAAHHILGHLPQQEQTAMTGALLAGVMAKSAGASAEDIRKAQAAGASIAARAYSKDFELQADSLGAEIALAAGYDPIRGAAYFDRLPDPGDRFLASHPGNSQRKAVVAATVRQLQGAR